MFRSSKTYLIVVSLSVFSLFSDAQELPLPKKFRSRAVFYLSSKQLKKFSCGYNVLFNAANLEYYCGFSNPMHKYSLFEKRVMPYVRSQRVSPKGESTNKMTEHLAQKVVNLQPFYHLSFQHKTSGPIVPLLTQSTRITYPRGISEREIQKRLQKAIKNRHTLVIKSIKETLFQAGEAVVHFLCYVTSSQGNRHGILATVYKNSTGRGLYIFDNMNDKITTKTDVTQFIEYLCSTFDISSRGIFKGPSLPRRWLHLDR